MTTERKLPTTVVPRIRRMTGDTDGPNAGEEERMEDVVVVDKGLLLFSMHAGQAKGKGGVAP